MDDTPFIGRQNELKRLGEIASKRKASLIVLKGRRRIGKTRLALEFGKSFKKTILMTGLPPGAGVTPAAQRESFGRAIAEQLHIPTPKSEDWSDLFTALSFHTQKGKTLIIFDEISWLGAGDPTFLGKLKTAWDTQFKANTQLLMMLTGSVSSWIERNILNSTGFVGRVSLEMTLDELPLHRCNEFWGKGRDLVSPHEKFKLLSVVGGIPRYLEEINPTLSAEENIRQLCFASGGLLVKEYQRIFSDLFHTKGPTYSKIVARLADGPCIPEEIQKSLKITRGGTFSDYLYDLETAGFIAQDRAWHLKSGKSSRLKKYRLKDNYLRFYIKYIYPNLEKIEKGLYQMHPSKWPTIFGLQFENLVLNSRKKIFEILQIDLPEIVYENPYFQKPTSRHRGCQIDYLIQTRDNILYLCEVKFSREAISCNAIEEVREKIQALALPAKFTVKPVLIHVNGVTDSLLGEDFFSRIIDFSQLLEN